MSCFAEIELIPWIFTFVLCLLIGVEVCHNMFMLALHLSYCGILLTALDLRFSHALCLPGHCPAERGRNCEIYWAWLLLTGFMLILTWLR